jgi:hypothetical protein
MFDSCVLRQECVDLSLNYVILFRVRTMKDHSENKGVLKAFLSAQNAFFIRKALDG